MYLTNPELVRASRHHTAYVGDGAITEDPRHPNRIYKVKFIDGVAYDVDSKVAQRLMDSGIASESPVFAPGGGRLDAYYGGVDVPIIGQ